MHLLQESFHIKLSYMYMYVFIFKLWFLFGSRASIQIWLCFSGYLCAEEFVMVS